MSKRAGTAGEFERILVVVTRQIGDVLVTTPLIHEARLRWPRARIDVLCFAGTVGMLRGNPDINELIEVKPGSGWLQSWPLIRRLWRRYDLALIAQYTERAHLYGLISAPVRSGQVPVGPEGRMRRMMLRHYIDLGADQSHVVLEKLKLLAPWAGSSASPKVVLPAQAALPPDIAAQLGTRYTVIQVPSLVRYKQWPLRHYIELVRQLTSQGHAIVLTGGPSPEDRAMVAQVHEQSGGLAIDTCGRLDFNQMATLLSGAALYIGPDTSITHLAAATGIPVVGLYGPIDPRLWGPWPAGWPREQPYAATGPRQHKGNIILLQGSQPCVPCNGAGCDKHRDSRSECLETMAPGRVLGEALVVLAQAQAKPPVRRD